VLLSTDIEDRVAPGAVLHTDRGDLRVDGSFRHKDGWVIAFAGVTDRSAAEELRGLVLRAEPVEDPEALWVHELIGSDVVDQHGTVLGVVREIEANPASDLLVLDSGALIPSVFVVSFDSGRVAVDVPDGLLDL
jgi:16S rRNA processing protein RimM